jgi:phosphate transport system substrate-binding protein
VTNSAKTLSPAAQAFFDYAVSKDAAAIITSAGAVPVAK